jgi:hypothetical protein
VKNGQPRSVGRDPSLGRRYSVHNWYLSGALRMMENVAREWGVDTREAVKVLERARRNMRRSFELRTGRAITPHPRNRR